MSGGSNGDVPDDTNQGESSGGSDVARNPDTIQREIEQTRAELADTIDAIADRISPRRVAGRSAQAVKSQVSSVFGGHGEANGHSGPASVLDADPTASAKVDSAARTRAVSAVAEQGGGAYTGTSQFAVSRRLRTDRVLLAFGAAAAVVGAIVLWRSRD
jgi:hypothetical protein